MSPLRPLRQDPPCPDRVPCPAPAQAPGAPTVDGPLVEVAPGAWVRAATVVAVEAFVDEDWQEALARGRPLGRPEYLASVVVAGGSDYPGWWRSVYAPGQLRAALRRAEEQEDLRRLRDLVRLVRLAGGRSSDP